MAIRLEGNHSLELCIRVLEFFNEILTRYVILNVQKDVNEDNATKYVYREVGSWDNIYKLNLNIDVVRFPNESKIYKSVCSEGCAFGHVKVNWAFFD